MKSICLILGIAVLYSSLPLWAQENYSLWPRRPQALEQARHLLKQQMRGEAAYLLQPYVVDAGVAGVEARSLVSGINVVRYLSRLHPHAHVYEVRRGDTLPKIAMLTQCPVDLLMLYNGIVLPSALKVGQKLVYIDMSLRMEVYPALSELTVWDGDILVASYRIKSCNGVNGKAVNKTEAKVLSTEAYSRGKKIPKNSPYAVSADKLVRLSDGCVISADENISGKALIMDQKDINELALLIKENNEVLWLDCPSAERTEEK